MSELINNAEKRRQILKHMILELHKGAAPESIQSQLKNLLGKIPYGDVVIVEQELIKEGLPTTEVLKLCDIHSQALKGSITTEGAKSIPEGHPISVFKLENTALNEVIAESEKSFMLIIQAEDNLDISDKFMSLREIFNKLQDVEKHYLRKENLLFPYLEKRGITGPPTVMWGKHDEIRELLKAAAESFTAAKTVTAGEVKALIEFIFLPVVSAVDEMIFKEENILFPMCMDTLTDEEWGHIHKLSPEIGFCLIDPKNDWIPDISDEEAKSEISDRIILPSGSFNIPELTAIFNTIPVDVTFVDKNDTVRFFSTGKERIFHRSRAIIGRKVQMCHPPSSVHIVEKILDDFKSGSQDKAAFWIQLHDKFIHIEYFAMRNEKGEYLGTLEVSQDLTEKRKLSGEQRLLKYEEKR